MKAARAFTHIDTWVFDLDNTLYPHHVNLWQQVDARIGEFVSRWLKVSAQEARVIQKDYYLRYGTTMRGMMTEHGVRADDYLAYVHQIDHSPLEPNPAMGAAIAKLPGRKLILTNGSTDHADKVLERLGIGAHFEAVFDIIAAELEPKPAPQTYRKFLADHAVNPNTSAMFEDLARNLVVPHQFGMTTVLVVPDGSREVVREDWELEGRDAAHVDHVTDDLTGFLQALVKPKSLSSPSFRTTTAEGALTLPRQIPTKPLVWTNTSFQGNLDVPARPRIHHQRRLRRPRWNLDRDQRRGARRRRFRP